MVLVCCRLLIEIEASHLLEALSPQVTCDPLEVLLFGWCCFADLAICVERHQASAQRRCPLFAHYLLAVGEITAEGFEFAVNKLPSILAAFDFGVTKGESFVLSNLL